MLAAINPVPPPYPGGNFSVGTGAILQTRQSTPTVAPQDGELPDEEPYLLAQILAASQSPAARAPDLVVLDMGINDTEIWNLVLPGKDVNAVVQRALSLAPRANFVMGSIAAAFPGAKVLVTGYYPVVSRLSHAAEIFQFTLRVIDAITGADITIPPSLQALVTAAQDVGAASGPLLDAVIVPGLADRSTRWTAAMHSVLNDAVQGFNAAGGTAAFVDPSFQPQHAVFAPESLLWPFRNGNPTDPMAPIRQNLCTTLGITGFDALIAECASMGHPGPLGAQRYADAMIAQARAIDVF